MILTHESGAQEDQFDENDEKWRPKISWYYPFKHSGGFQELAVFCCFPAFSTAADGPVGLGCRHRRPP